MSLKNLMQSQYFLFFFPYKLFQWKSPSSFLVASKSSGELGLRKENFLGSGYSDS